MCNVNATPSPATVCIRSEPSAPVALKLFLSLSIHVATFSDIAYVQWKNLIDTLVVMPRRLQVQTAESERDHGTCAHTFCRDLLTHLAAQVAMAHAKWHYKTKQHVSSHIASWWHATSVPPVFVCSNTHFSCSTHSCLRPILDIICGVCVFVRSDSDESCSRALRFVHVLLWNACIVAGGAFLESKALKTHAWECLSRHGGCGRRISQGA